MKKILMVCLLGLMLCLGGCFSWMDGEYSKVTPYRGQTSQEDQQMLCASSYTELRDALVEMAEASRETALIAVPELEQDRVGYYMDQAKRHVMEKNPIGAYAVEDIAYELGTSSGQPALAVSITFNHNRAEIRRIKECNGMEAASNYIAIALNNCDAGVILLVDNFEETDFAQQVQDYADAFPEYVMELPQVTVNVFPEEGNLRLVELKFSYQTSRESLRDMQSRVRPLFDAAELYVSGDASTEEKYAQLYAFLMERATYEVQTSITPSYSLLHHSVGDSKAFAVVYAAMCRRAGLECMVVSGTMDGEPRFWNIVNEDGTYFHLDLLRSSDRGQMNCRSDADMQGYVWDYSAYPACGILPDPTEVTE